MGAESAEAIAEERAETERDYGGRAAYDKAKETGKTKLNYHQWIEVRTPRFLKWFGDWINKTGEFSELIDHETGEPAVMYHGTARDIDAFKPKQANAIFVTANKEFADDFSLSSEFWMLEHPEEWMTPEQMDEYNRRKLKSERIYLSGHSTDEYYKAKRELEKYVVSQFPSYKNVIPLFVSAKKLFHGDRPEQVQELYDYAKEHKYSGGTIGALERYLGFLRNNSSRYALADGFDTSSNWRLIESKDVQEIIRALGYDGFVVMENDVSNTAVYSPSQVKSAISNTGEYSKEDDRIRYSEAEDTEKGEANDIGSGSDGESNKRAIKFNGEKDASGYDDFDSDSGQNNRDGLGVRIRGRRGKRNGGDGGNSETGRQGLGGEILEEQGLYFSGFATSDGDISTPARTLNARVDAILSSPAGGQAPGRFIDNLFRAVFEKSRIAWVIEKVFDKAGDILSALTPEFVKAGIISDYGIPEAVLDARRETNGRISRLTRETGTLLDRLATLTRAESRVAYEWLNTGDSAIAAELEADLPEQSREVLREVKEMIDGLSREAVRLGQLSKETYQRNRFAYLHRSYVKYTAELSGSEKAERARRIEILGNNYHHRGLDMLIDRQAIVDILKRAGFETKELKGTKISRYKSVNKDGKTVSRFWPDSVPLPNAEAWNKVETWEVRGQTKDGKLQLWRDFTKAERECRRLGCSEAETQRSRNSPGDGESTPGENPKTSSLLAQAGIRFVDPVFRGRRPLSPAPPPRGE
jgi:hypothetical protein